MTVLDASILTYQIISASVRLYYVCVSFSFYVCKSDEIWGLEETLTILFGLPPT